MSYRVMVRVGGEEAFVGNGLFFETKEEADSYGEDLFSRWMAVEEWKIEEATERANYKWENGSPKFIGEEVSLNG